MTAADTTLRAEQPAAAPEATQSPIPGIQLEAYPDLVAWLAKMGKGGQVQPDVMSAFLNWVKPFEVERVFAGLSTGHFSFLPSGAKLWPGAAEQQLFFEKLRPVLAGSYDVNAWGDGMKLSDAMAKFDAAYSAVRDAQSQLTQLYEQSWKDAQTRFLDELAAMQAEGRSFMGIGETLGAWTKTLSAVAHEVLASPAATKLLTEAMHCASRLRLAQSHLIELVSESLNVPTRSEMDEAYRLIHELRREIRTLRRAD